jgi:hypothetical protein
MIWEWEIFATQLSSKYSPLGEFNVLKTTLIMRILCVYSPYYSLPPCSNNAPCVLGAIDCWCTNQKSMGMKKDEQQTLCPVYSVQRSLGISCPLKWLVYFAAFQLLPWHISQWDPEFCVSSYDEFGQQQQQQQQSISPRPPLLTG